jgi:hypothetical protein
MQDLFLIGTLKKIFEEVQVSDSFKKKEFVLETIEDYPQTFKIELTQDKTGKIAPFKVGDVIKVQYNMRGREYTKDQGTNKEKTFYFTTLNAWRITLETQENTPAPNTQENTTTDDGADELPF